MPDPKGALDKLINDYDIYSKAAKKILEPKKPAPEKPVQGEAKEGEKQTPAPR